MTQRMNGLSFPFLAGATAGCIATIPMTIFMLTMHRVLPKWQHYALPPEELTREMAERADIKQHINKSQLLGASLVAHFGYGTTMGAIYALLLAKAPLPSMLKGIAFGLTIWAASYLGWIPLAGFSVAAPREPARRNLLMICAHIIWGSVTSMVVKQLLSSLRSHSA